MQQVKTRVTALRIRDIELEQLLIGDKTGSKAKISYYNGDIALVPEAPFLEVTAVTATKSASIYQVDTIFVGDKQHRIKECFDFFSQLDRRAYEHVMENAHIWFPNVEDIEVKTLIKKTDNDYFFRWLIDFDKTAFLDQEKNPTDPTNIKVGSYVKNIFEIPSIWINDSQCGYTCLVKKVMIRPATNKQINDYDFADSASDVSDDGTNDIVSLMATEQAPKQTRNIPEAVVSTPTPKLVMPESTPKLVVPESTPKLVVPESTPKLVVPESTPTPAVSPVTKQAPTLVPKVNVSQASTSTKSSLKGGRHVGVFFANISEKSDMPAPKPATPTPKKTTEKANVVTINTPGARALIEKQSVSASEVKRQIQILNPFDSDEDYDLSDNDFVPA